MTEILNLWALKYYKPLVKETIGTVRDEVEAATSGKRLQVFSSPSDVYALASRFKNALYRYPFFKKKHLRILRAIIDRCGEAYYEKNPSKLYISSKVLEEWVQVFSIPADRAMEYLRPLRAFRILEQSDSKDYIYRVNNEFFQLIGPVAQHLVVPVDTKRFAEMMAVASGITSIYVISTSARSRVYGEHELVPWFLKLPMIYTFTGLEPGSMKIRDVLEIRRINAVDNYFVIERGAPVELWRSIRTEAFEFMADNAIIEQAVPNGYKLNALWIRVHEEGIKRYVMRVRERYERKYRGY